MDSLQNQGYSVFCVVKGLPEPCNSAAGTERGLPQYWWKEQDLLQGKMNATMAATDPWRDVGSGMRLDGKSTARSTNSAGGGLPTQGDMGGLTDDEMLQMVLMASLDHTKTPATGGDNDSAKKKVTVPPEPPAGTTDAVRIQFRMPDGKRVIRRFLSEESVEVVYAFVEESCGGGSKKLELRYGFPPKDLETQRSKTISEAQISGESIQGRYL